MLRHLWGDYYCGSPKTLNVLFCIYGFLLPLGYTMPLNRHILKNYVKFKLLMKLYNVCSATANLNWNSVLVQLLELAWGYVTYPKYWYASVFDVFNERLPFHLRKIDHDTFVIYQQRMTDYFTVYTSLYTFSKNLGSFTVTW